MVTDWPLGLAPFCTAEKAINDGFCPILGADGGGDVVDVVVGVMSCDSPGIAVESPCNARPPPLPLFPAFPLPLPLPPGAATPANELEVGDDEVVPLEVAPASESELVAVEKAFVGVIVLDVVGLTVVVESLLCRVVLLVVVPELTVPESVDVVGA